MKLPILFQQTCYLSAILLFATCQKPAPPQTTPAIQATSTQTIQGHHNPHSCRTFFDARRSDSGMILHDDTTAPQNCHDDALPFQLQTFLLPIGTKRYRGIRLSGAYPFQKEQFQLFSAAHPHFHQQTAYLYTFRTPGHYVLQTFFPETAWQDFITHTDRIEFSFQITPSLSSPPPTPEFTLLQGRYYPTTNALTLDQELVNIGSPELQFQFLDSIGLTPTLRIRSVYTLLTEDFALWQTTADCREYQNWDLQLIPATGYHLLQATIDPPFLDCLLQESEFINFRIALLR